MQLRFWQTRRQPKPAYEITCAITGRQLGTAEAEDCSHPTITLEGQLYTVDIPGRKIQDERGKTSEISPILLRGEERGGIEICFVETKKILFLSTGYDYRRVTLDGITITAYEAGMGAGAHYWCIYRDDRELAAMIHMSDGAVNYCNHYTLYLEDEALYPAVCLLALFIDCTQYPDIGEVSGLSVQGQSTVTLQKELLAKYDPDFIPRVMRRDGNFPE